MRRIDAIAITIGFFVLGGVAFWGFKAYGFSSENAGVWSQAVLILFLLGWVFTYVFRASTQTMTYNQQLKDYETAFLKKQLEAMSPEELTQLQAEVE